VNRPAPGTKASSPARLRPTGQPRRQARPAPPGRARAPGDHRAAVADGLKPGRMPRGCHGGHPWTTHRARVLFCPSAAPYPQSYDLERAPGPYGSVMTAESEQPFSLHRVRLLPVSGRRNGERSLRQTTFRRYVRERPRFSRDSGGCGLSVRDEDMATCRSSSSLGRRLPGHGSVNHRAVTSSSSV
jgi:hypothetical protein